MKTIRLKHHKRLRLRTNKKAILPQGFSGDDSTYISFRETGTPSETIVVDATTRLTPLGSNKQVFLDHIETDSGIASPLVGDILHALPTEAKVYLRDDAANPIIERDYYALAFKKIEQNEDYAVYTKTSSCLTEGDVGLDKWSFCIPCGPGDATLVNKVVSRILTFTDLDFEILISGTPGENFKYKDAVRFVPERREGSITEPGTINICEKKNILADNALHPNLCILHDRVFLPSNFGKVMKRYGEIYAMHTLQSLYFDDYLNLACVRYSDVNVVTQNQRKYVATGLMKDKKGLSPFASGTVSAIQGNSGFAYQHAMRHSEHSYATGSMYICKRSLWQKYPQNENIQWGELEDVEHGFRMQDAGVSVRINPYGLTQSLNCRGMLLADAKVRVISAAGKRDRAKLPIPYGKTRRKPFFRVSQDKALEGLKALATKYGYPDYEPKLNGPEFTSADWMLAVFKVANNISFPYHFDDVRQFVLDWTKSTSFDSSNYHANERYTFHIYYRGDEGLADFIKRQPVFVSMLCMRPDKSLFCSAPSHYMCNDSLTLRIGSAWSAFRLWWTRYQHAYCHGGPMEYFRMIIASTPFQDKS